MLFVLLAWVLQFIVVAGWGALLWRLFAGRETTSVGDVFRFFWLGFCGLVVLLQIISLVLPLRAIWLGLGAVLLWPTGNWRPAHTALAALTVAVMGWWWCARPVITQQPVWWHIGDSGRGNCRPVTLQNGQQPPLVVWASCTSDQCGDAPLPCTPYPRDVLCLRVPGDLRHGFYVKTSTEGQEVQR